MDGVGNIKGINDDQLINVIHYHNYEPDIIEHSSTTDSVMSSQCDDENVDVNVNDINDIPDIDDMMKMDPINISRISSIILDKTVFDVMPRYYLYKVSIPPTASSSSMEPIIISNPSNVKDLSSISQLLPLNGIDRGVSLIGTNRTLKVSFDSLGSFDLPTLQAMKTIHQIKNVAAQVSLEISWLNSVAHIQPELVEDIKTVLWRNCLNHCLYIFPATSFEDSATITVDSLASMTCDRLMHVEMMSLIWTIMQQERQVTDFFLPSMLSVLLQRCSSETELLSLGKRVFASTPSTSFQRVKKLFLVIHHANHYSLVVIIPNAKKWYWADSKHQPVPTDASVSSIINRLINMIHLHYRYIHMYSEIWRSLGEPISSIGYLMPHQKNTNFCGFLVCMAAVDIGKGKLTKVREDEFPTIRLQYINQVLSFIDP